MATAPNPAGTQEGSQSTTVPATDLRDCHKPLLLQLAPRGEILRTGTCRDLHTLVAQPVLLQR